MTEESKPISTQEELDALIRDRLKRDRAKTAEKYADYEDLKVKAAKLDELEEAQEGELERANEKIAKLEKDAADRAAAEKARELKERVATSSHGTAFLPKAGVSFNQRLYTTYDF